MTCKPFLYHECTEFNDFSIPVLTTYCNNGLPSEPWSVCYVAAGLLDCAAEPPCGCACKLQGMHLCLSACRRVFTWLQTGYHTGLWVLLAPAMTPLKAREIKSVYLAGFRVSETDHGQ